MLYYTLNRSDLTTKLKMKTLRYTIRIGIIKIQPKIIPFITINLPAPAVYLNVVKRNENIQNILVDVPLWKVRWRMEFPRKFKSYLLIE